MDDLHFGVPESSGTFTVSLEDAARKLGRYQLASLTHALYKVAQGSGAARLELHQEPNLTRMWPIHNTEDPDFLLGYNTLLQRTPGATLTNKTLHVPVNIPLDLDRFAVPVTWNGYPHHTGWTAFPDGFAYRLTDHESRGFPRKGAILLDPIALDAPPGLDVAFPADHLPVDLGQFTLLQAPEPLPLLELMHQASRDPSALDRLLNVKLDQAEGKHAWPQLLTGLGLLLTGFGAVGGVVAALGASRLALAHYRLKTIPKRRADLQYRLRSEWGLP